jgi:DHA1 family multidrug resistance protein-like MFS transporter
MNELTDEQRARGLRFLLVSSFITFAAYFMLLPLIAVHYVDDLGWSSVIIGAVLALNTIAQQGLSPLSGWLADRHGARGLIGIGLFIRGAGYALCAIADSPPILFAVILLAGIGGGLFDAPESAVIATLTDDTTRRRYYAIVGSIGAVAGAVGTQIGLLLLDIDFVAVALVAGSGYIAAGLASFVYLPRTATGAVSTGDRNALRRAASDRPFLFFSGLLLGYWFVTAQATITIPLRATDIAGDGVLKLLFGLNTVVTIVLGYPLLRFLEHRLSPRKSVVAGLICHMIAFTGLAVSTDRYQLLACASLIALGMLIARPGVLALTVDLADQRALGSYLGVNALFMGIGGAAGSFGGGALYDLGDRFNFAALPWLVFGGLSILTAFGLTRFVGDRRAISDDHSIGMPNQALRA